MQGSNTFENGLHRMNDPKAQPEGSYRDALNWIRNDAGELTNEDKEVITSTIPNSILLGSTPIKNKFVCFIQKTINGVKESEIGLFENGVYTTVFNDTNHNYELNFTNSIDCVARVINTGEIVVYFAEGDVTVGGTLVKGNIPRRFNIDEYINKGNSTTIYNEIKDFSLQLDILLPYPTLEVTTGGSLPSGVYAVVLRYVNDDNNKTTFGIPSRFISIIDDDGTGENADGCPPGTQTNKTIRIKVNHVDPNYLYIEPVIITFDGIANNLVIKSIGVYPNVEGSVILFTDESQLQSTVATSEITENPIFYSNAKSIEQKDNILVLSNLTGKVYDRDFQAVANNIDVCWKHEDLPYTNYRGINFQTTPHVPYGSTQDDGSYDNTDPRQQFLTFPSPIGIVWNKPPGLFKTTVYEYNTEVKDVATNPVMPFKNNELKGFQRGEVYSFSITPIYKDGSIGFAYHIPGKVANNTSGYIRCQYYKSTELYPKYIVDAFPSLGYDATDGKNYILHHKMPDVINTGVYDKCDPVFSNSVRGNHVSKIKVIFRNINFTPAQQDAIQGFIIGYQPRNSELNTRIIDTGIAKPYIANGDNYRQSFFNGSCHIKYPGNGATMTYAPQQPYCMYYSPDTLLGKKINESYSIQKVGYIKNSITNDNPNVNETTGTHDAVGIIKNVFSSNPGQVGNFLLATDIKVFFEDGGTIIKNEDPRRIVKSIEVPIIADTNKVDGKFELKLSSPYTHIESAATIWGNFQDLDPPQFTLKQNLDSFGFENICNLTSVRILNELSNLYGRLENAVYTPIGVSYDLTVNSNLGGAKVEVEGDVYISQYWYTIKDGIQLNYTGGNNFDGTLDIASFDFLAGVWVESKNNYNFMHYDTQEVSYYPKDKLLCTTATTTLGVLDYDFTKRSLGYNKQYSALNNIKPNFPKPLFFQEVVEFTNRSIYSEKAFDSEVSDQYRVFYTNNFHDIPKDRGVITDTFVFSNTFFHHTEYGLWQSFFNPNTTQTTSTGQVTLGNAGVFKLPSKIVIDIKGGYMGTFDKSGINTPFGRIFLDHSQGKAFIFDGETPAEISDLGLFNDFKKFINIADAGNYAMGYDWKNRRMLLSNTNKNLAISFYVKSKTWTSFHDFAPNSYLSLNGECFAFKDDSFFNLVNANNVKKNTEIIVSLNTGPADFKIFDSISLNHFSTDAKNIDEGDYSTIKETFSTLQIYNTTQNSGEMPITIPTKFEDYDDYYLVNGVVTNRLVADYNNDYYNIKLPSDAVVNPYNNIFLSSNIDMSKEFKNSMRGKFALLKLKYYGQNTFKLSFLRYDVRKALI